MLSGRVGGDFEPSVKLFKKTTFTCLSGMVPGTQLETNTTHGPLSLLQEQVISTFFSE